jgi:hypothetical protein
LLKPQPAQTCPRRPEGSGRLRRAQAQAASGSPRQPSGRLRHVCTAQHAQVRPYGSRHAQARLLHGSGTSARQAAQARLSTPRQAQITLRRASRRRRRSRRHRHAKKAHQARPSTLRQAQDGSVTLRCSTTVRQVRFRRCQVFRHAQTRSETSDRLRYACKLCVLCTAQARPPPGRLQHGTTKTRSSQDTLRKAQTAGLGIHSSSSRSGRPAGSQAGSSSSESRNCRKRLVSFRPDMPNQR